MNQVTITSPAGSRSKTRTLLRNLSIAAVLIAAPLAMPSVAEAGPHGGHGGPGGHGGHGGHFGGGHFGHGGGRFWGGRWYGYGVGPCWRWDGYSGQWVWVCY